MESMIIPKEDVERIGKGIISEMKKGDRITEEEFAEEIKKRWCDELLDGMVKKGLLKRISTCNNSDHDEYSLAEEST